MPELPGNDPQLVVIIIFAVGFGLAILINIYGLWRLMFREMRYRPGDLSSPRETKRETIDYPAGPGLTGRSVRSGGSNRHRNTDDK